MPAMRDREVLVGPRATAYGRLCPGGQGARWTERTPIPVTDIFDELQWRGLVAQTTDEAALREALAEGPITLYCGFDPSAPSLHFGNFVQLSVMRRMQAAGHRVICLVGGSTGLIGDPKPDAERVLQDKDTIATAVSRIQQLVGPLRDVGRHFRVNQMIRKEAVARRLESDQGISYTEFSYQMLQAFDYLELYRSRGCTLQIGGSDQWGNITAGVDLVHRVEGRSVHALATPLLVDSTGRKFGKSEGNAVWLSADMTSPYVFYQYFLNVEDASVISMLKALSDRSRDEITELERQVAEEPFRRAAQKALAADVTTLVHGAEATASVQAASEALFGKGDLTGLDASTLTDATAELPGAPVSVGTSVVDALVAVGLVDSRNAARRAIGDGGASLNNVKVTDPEQVLGEGDFLHGSVAVIKRGRRNLAAARRA